MSAVSVCLLAVQLHCRLCSVTRQNVELLPVRVGLLRHCPRRTVVFTLAANLFICLQNADISPNSMLDMSAKLASNFKVNHKQLVIQMYTFL